MTPRFSCIYGLIGLALTLSLSTPARSESISTNSISMPDAPKWLTESRVERVVENIQRHMEWDIRKASVKWWPEQASFQQFHGYDASVLAVSKKLENSIHLGPRVTSTNFDAVFGHELVHIILFQKYKTAVPKWLDEGLANYIAKQGRVDYAWLATQTPRDLRSLAHPFKQDQNSTGARYHYQASTAAIEMIASRCSLHDLLQLSVGEKLENYLSTFCRLPDLNSEFNKWVQKNHKLPPKNAEERG